MRSSTLSIDNQSPAVVHITSHHLAFLSLLAVMATSTPLDPFLRGSTSKKTRGLLRIIILFTIAGAAVSARLFSVIRTWKYQIDKFAHTNYVLKDSKA